MTLCYLVYACSAVAAQFGTKQAAPVASESAIAGDEKREYLGGGHSGEPLLSQPEPERLFIAAEAQDTFLSKAGAVSAQPVPEATPASESEQAAKLDLPSKSIILKHAWDPLEPQDTTSFFDELEQDMCMECTKFGAVDHVRFWVYLLPNGWLEYGHTYRETH